MKGNYAARAKRGGKRPENGDWIREVLEDEAADGCVKFSFRGKLRNIGLRERDDVQSCLRCTRFGELNGIGIAFNTNDDVRWPTGYGRLTNGSTMPYVLPANTWHCVEISYDNAGRVQQLFVAGTQLINATNYPAMTTPPPPAIKIFKFGFQTFHGPDRQMWYDNVAVAPTRIGGCN